ARMDEAPRVHRVVTLRVSRRLRPPRGAEWDRLDDDARPRHGGLGARLRAHRLSPGRRDEHRDPERCERARRRQKLSADHVVRSKRSASGLKASTKRSFALDAALSNRAALLKLSFVGSGHFAFASSTKPSW